MMIMMMMDTYNSKLLDFDMSLQVFTAMLIRISLVSHNALLTDKLLRVFRVSFLPPYSVLWKMEATSSYKTSVTNLQSHDAIRQETLVFSPSLNRRANACS